MLDHIIKGDGYQCVPGTNRKDAYPNIVCADGTSLSVQASQSHYSLPREDFGPYTAVEVGYPSADVPESWNEFKQGDLNVFAFVPVELVRAYVASHGGEVNAPIYLTETTE